MTVPVELASSEEMDDRPEDRILIYNQSPKARVTDCAARVRHRLQSKVGLDLLWRGKRFYIHQPSQAESGAEPLQALEIGYLCRSPTAEAEDGGQPPCLRPF